MITYTTTSTSWIIEVPTGDAQMPWICMGSWFKTEQHAIANLKGWRKELQEAARVREHTYESFTAHEA
jgi:hypothetical protein